MKIAIGIGLLLVLICLIAYVVTILITMLGSWIGYRLRKCLVEKFSNPFNEQAKPCNTCGNQGWYVEYISYVVEHRNIFWWAPILWLEEIRNRIGIRKNKGKSECGEGYQKRPLNLIPKVLVDGVSEPPPESHADNLAQGDNHVNHKQTEPI